jgi:hypothetical protein
MTDESPLKISRRSTPVKPRRRQPKTQARVQTAGFAPRLPLSAMRFSHLATAFHKARWKARRKAPEKTLSRASLKAHFKALFKARTKAHFKASRKAHFKARGKAQPKARLKAQFKARSKAWFKARSKPRLKAAPRAVSSPSPLRGNCVPARRRPLHIDSRRPAPSAWTIRRFHRLHRFWLLSSGSGFGALRH